MRLRSVSVPLAPDLEPEPLLAQTVYEQRLHGLRARAERSGLEAVLDGSPLSCHVSAAVGHWGALTCRAGLVARGEDPRTEEFIVHLATPYIRAVRTWYTTLETGVRGGDLTAAVASSLAGTGVSLALNPGHLIGHEEWLDSPFVPGGDAALRSGMCVQCDLIPLSSVLPDGRANVEDGVALADADLRSDLAERFPALWRRVVERRRVFADELGIPLHDDVLPLAERAGLFAPGPLSPDLVLVE